MNDSEKDRIQRRIKKCLALSSSDNEHEAAAALRQAKRMMDKYGIDIADATEPDFDVHDLSSGKRSKSKLTQAEKALYGVVSRFFGCSLYYQGGWPVIIGIAPAPKITEYAATVLLRQMRRGYDDVLKRMEDSVGGELNVATKRKVRHSYSLAWASSVEEKVRAFAAAIMPEQKRAHEKVISKYWGMDASTVKPTRTRGIKKDCIVSNYAAQNGLKDGKRANLSMAMQSEYSPPARLNSEMANDR